jgi:release factor glutamine methyltransferase
MTYYEFQHKLKEELSGIYEADEAAQIAMLLLEEVTGYTRSRLRAADREEIPETFTFKLYKYLHALLQHQPVQYALGYAWFYKNKFAVSPAVLIPRRETEELVYRVVKEYRGREATMLDIGTGSGCIAITLQKELPQANITAIDISADALEVACKNAESLDAGKIRFIQTDILQAHQTTTWDMYDAIISNPPYITPEEKNSMPNNVVMHEPHQALFVTNNDPLQFYKAIASFAVKHLRNGGMIFLECHEHYAQEVAKLLQTNFKHIEVLRDMQGKERMITATYISHGTE